MQLFLLDFSFILRWLAIPLIFFIAFVIVFFILGENASSARNEFTYLLLILFAGILSTYFAVLYFVPYIETTRILFYEEVIKEQQIEE